MLRRFDEWATNKARFLASKGPIGKAVLFVLLIPMVVIVFFRLVWYLGWPKQTY